MREKQLCLIVTFHTTTAAMAAESICAAQSIPGRLIPVPREITAGCGMSFKAPTEARAQIESALSAANIAVDGFYELVL